MTRDLLAGLLALSLLTAVWAAWHVVKPQPLPGSLGLRYRRMGLRPGELRVFSSGTLLTAVGFASGLVAILASESLAVSLKVGMIVLGTCAICIGVAIQVISAGRAQLRRGSGLLQLTTQPLGIILLAAAILALAAVIVGVILMLLP